MSRRAGPARAQEKAYRPGPDRRLGRRSVARFSRFPSKERPHMPVSKTTPGRPGARVDAPVRVAFRAWYHVSTQDEFSFAVRWLAYAFPCRRFADALAGARAWLGADAGRYSFIVVDSHHLLLAGLPGAHRAKSQPCGVHTCSISMRRPPRRTSSPRTKKHG